MERQHEPTEGKIYLGMVVNVGGTEKIQHTLSIPSQLSTSTITLVCDVLFGSRKSRIWEVKDNGVLHKLQD